MEQRRRLWCDGLVSGLFSVESGEKQGWLLAAGWKIELPPEEGRWRLGLREQPRLQHLGSRKCVEWEFEACGNLGHQPRCLL